MRHWFSDLVAFRRDPLTFFLDRGSRAQSPLERLAMGPGDVFLVCDPQVVRQILKAPTADIDKGRLIQKLSAVIGRSSMTLSGEAHAARRRVLHQQMARGLAAGYVPQISALIRRQAASLAQESAFDAHHTTARLTLRVICMILFGAGALTQADENLLIEAIQEVEDDLAADMFRVLPHLPWVARAKAVRMRATRDKMGLVVTRARMRAEESSLLVALAALDLSDEEIADEVLLLLLAGHHTTGSAAAWLLYHLAQDPELCEEIAGEAKAVSDGAGEPIAARLPTATKSLALVREVLRLYPSSWWMSREVQRPLELGGQKLKRGASLLISPWHLHRDPRFWERPERFEPSRPHNGPAYIPFGSGPRACVAMGLGLLELQLVALEFASAYQITPSSEPADRPRPSITLIPPALPLRIASRIQPIPLNQAWAT
ncbi:cytochrome P450 [Xanthobacter sp. DSM 24535]|uniref:cytochrome P450 n=1 Tax=Roseixanthobacter psychrophilus TaxID=3119917 RepID=UPI003726FADB